VLRVQGWRLYSGPSQTGKPLDVTLCPWCAGTATGPEPSWRVGCDTCWWEYEPFDGEEPITQKEAQRIADDHECEPDTWVKAPDVEAKKAASAPVLALEAVDR
jgi:hypothetical protein